MADEETMRLAAVADLHYGRGHREQMAAVLSEAAETADVLLLAGDLTDRGEPTEAEMLVEDVDVGAVEQVLCVLGNHDHATDQPEEVSAVLERGGLSVLDGDYRVVDGVGFAGVKGFGGGFGERAVQPFGERALRDFVAETVEDALELETALSQADTRHCVVLLHYAPILATLAGEPDELYPFLGSSRLEDPINHGGADLVFHGHAHKGTPRGETTGGVPVFNVSVPVLREARPEEPPFVVHELERGE